MSDDGSNSGQFISVAAITGRHHLHGDGCQSAIWLDLFRRPDGSSASLGARRHPFAFSLFVATETWLVPVEAWFVDKFGPQRVIAFGGVMVAIAWALNSVADSLPMLYPGRSFPASARARSTAPASAMRSNGSPIAAALPPA